MLAFIARRLKPAGTPGKTNANYSAQIPPIIANAKLTPENPAPDQPMTVEATVRDDAGGVGEVKLVYRIAGPGFEKPEASVPMKKTADDRYTAVIPGQAANQLIRLRVEATGAKGARRIFPALTEPRPEHHGDAGLTMDGLALSIKALWRRCANM